MRVVFEIVTDQSGVAQGINDLKARIKDLNKEIVNKSGTNTPDQIQRYTRELVEAQNQVKGLTEQQKQLNREFQQTRVPTDSLAGLRLEYAKLTDQINKYTAAERNSPTGRANIDRAANLSKEIGGIEKSLGRFTGNVGNYQSAFNGFSKTIGGIGAAFAVLQGGNLLIDATRETEKFFAVLKQATGNESTALRIFDQIKQFALETPFQLNEVVGSFVKLEQRNFKPTIEQLRVLGDIASALGKPIDQLVEAVLDAQQGEFERLKEFGIKFKKDGDQLKAEFKGQQTVIENSAEAISAYLLSLGKLPSIQGAASAVAATLDGAISNLVDNFTQLAAGIGGTGGLLTSFINGLSGGISAINKFISTPLSEKLQEQQGEFNALVNVLKDVNTEESTRNLAIQQLQKDYPDYIGNINLETASADDLNKVLAEGNKLFLQRIFLQQNEEKFADFARRRIALERQLFEERKRAQNASSGAQGSLSSLAGAFESTAPQFTVTAIKQLEEEIQNFSQTQDELAKSLFGSADAAAKAKSEYGNLRNGIQDAADTTKSSSDTAAGSLEALRKAVQNAREALEKAPQNKVADALKILQQAEKELQILESRVDVLRTGRAVTVRGATIDKGAVTGGTDAGAPPELQDTGGGFQLGTTEADLEASIENNQILVDDTEFTAEQILQLEKDLSDKKIGLTADELKERLKLEEEAEKERDKLRKLGIDSAIQAGEDVANAIFEIQKNQLEAQTDAQLSELEKQYAAKLEAAAGNADLEASLNAELENKKKDIEKEAADKRKELAKKEAIINIALAIIKALTGAPPPASFILAGAAAVAGGAQLAVIENTQFAKGGFTGDGFDYRDSTGRRVAGVVHENEYVAPQSQIQRMPWVFSELERDRLANMRPFAAGGFTSTIVPNFPASTATPASQFQTDARGFTDEQVKELGTGLGDVIGSIVGFEVRKQLSAGINDNNRLNERQTALSQSRKV